MAIPFRWSATKASENRKKHGVSFEDAATVLGDPLSMTVTDPDHSSPGDERFVTIGQSRKGAIFVVVHSEQDELIRIISARRASPREKKSTMKKRKPSKQNSSMRAEYDFSRGVRGKYAKRYAEGNNLILIDPDLLGVFPDSESVNEALRALAGIIRKRSTGTA